METGGQLDLFSITAIDPPWRDNRDAMGYPFVSLQKRRTTAIRYSDGNVWLMVSAPAEFGIATIWDWDVMIFAASHINEAIESGRKVSPRITFAPHDCLKQIGRQTGGTDYRHLADAIRRLHATMVITDIREADQPERGEEQGFHWLHGYSLPKKYGRRVYTTPDNITHITPNDPEGEPDPTRPWVIRIHPWLYNAIVRRGDILAVHPDYFRLTGGLERWLYRLARKAVPDQAEPPAIRFKMETLHARSGVTRDIKLFAFDIRKIAEMQPLPEYGIAIEHRKGQRELVTLYRDAAKPCRPPRGRRLKTVRGEHIQPAVNLDAYLEEPPPTFVIEPTPEPPPPPPPPPIAETPQDVGARTALPPSKIADLYAYVNAPIEPPIEWPSEVLAIGEALERLYQALGTAGTPGSGLAQDPDPIRRKVGGFMQFIATVALNHERGGKLRVARVAFDDALDEVQQALDRYLADR